MSDIWGTDTQPSMPHPIEDRPVVVDFGGFAFTTGGMAHNLTVDDAEELAMPTYAPADTTEVGE